MLATTIVVTALTSGCVEATSDIVAPRLYEYTPEEQVKAVDELEFLRSSAPLPCITCQMIEDYGSVRAEIRAMLR